MWIISTDHNLINLNHIISILKIEENGVHKIIAWSAFQNECFELYSGIYEEGILDIYASLREVLDVKIL